MDFSNEPYVRVYTRNTTTWRRLEWQGQCVLIQMLRVVDRSGVLDIEDMTPAEAVSLHTGICLLYTSPSPRDGATSRMPSSA